MPAAVAAVARSSTTESAAPAADSCVVISGDGGAACGETVNQCVSADSTSCYFTAGTQRIDCASCADMTTCEASLRTACPYAATCTTSTAGCDGTTVSTCSSGSNSCYFIVGSARIDCVSCAAKDVSACSGLVQLACSNDAGADAGPTDPGD